MFVCFLKIEVQFSHLDPDPENQINAYPDPGAKYKARISLLTDSKVISSFISTINIKT